MNETPMPPDLLPLLVCPVDRKPLRLESGNLLAESGRRYPVVEGVPVFLLDGDQTIPLALKSKAAEGDRSDPFHIDSVGVSPEQAANIRNMFRSGDTAIDPVVSYLVAATNGNAYKHLVGKLREYPIPELRLPDGGGKLLLDIGASWGRWSIAASKRGYRPIVFDPSLGAVLAARRVFSQMGLSGYFAVGDARHLPFAPGTFDSAFSYSVLQHLSRVGAAGAVAEIGRVLKPGGQSLVQMPTILGVRCLMHQLRRGFREPRDFEVRYYSVPALRNLFESRIGPTRTSVDCYFGIGLQKTELKSMTPLLKLAVRASELLRGVAKVFPPLKYLADSVYLESRKSG